MPERDIESLGVIGWGLDTARKFFRHRRRRRRRRRPPNLVRVYSTKAAITCYQKIRYPFLAGKSPCGSAAT